MRACTRCGSNDISFNSVVGNTFLYKGKNITINTNTDLTIKQCNNCKEHFFNRKRKDAKNLDKVLEQEFSNGSS